MQPGTPDYQALDGRFRIDNPHDCIHPLTPTSLPLRGFSRLYAKQVVEGTAVTPARIERRPPLLADILRTFVASWRDANGYQKLFQDYPRELRG